MTVEQAADEVVKDLYSYLDTPKLLEVLDAGRAHPPVAVVLLLNSAIERELQRRAGGQA